MEQAGIAEDIHIIHNGIDIEKFSGVENDIRQKLKIPPDTFLAGYFGRLHPEKGIEYLIEAINNMPAYLLCVGWNSDQEYAVSLKEAASERIRFCLPVLDVVPYMSAIDSLVLPSVCPESFGLVLCEAMALGKPVITTTTGGQGEIVEDGVSGFTVPAASSSAIAEKLYRLMNDKNLYGEMSKAASSSVRQKFSLEIMAPKTRELFTTSIK